MEANIKFTHILLSVVLPCMCLIFQKNLTNAQNATTSGVELEPVNILANSTFNGTVLNIYGENETSIYSNLTETGHENGTELVFQRTNQSEFVIGSFDETALYDNSTTLNETELLFPHNSSSSRYGNRTARPFTSSGYDFMNETTLTVNAPGFGTFGPEITFPPTEDSNNNITENNTLILKLSNVNETENFSNDSYISTNATDILFVTNTTEGYTAEKVTTSMYELPLEDELNVTNSNVSEARGFPNSTLNFENKTSSDVSTENVLDSSTELDNTSTTKTTRLNKITSKAKSDDNETSMTTTSATKKNGSVVSEKDEFTQVSTVSEQGDTVNSTESTPTKVTLLTIPYAYGNESTSTDKVLTDETAKVTTLMIPITTPSGRSAAGTTTTTEKDIDHVSGKGDENKVKPGKKTYEELLPEEKENIVTIVFNKLIGNWTANFEDSFSYFVSEIMDDYVKVWSTVKETENELGPGLERAQVTKKNVHYLKPTPYFSKDLTVAMVTFYVTSSTPAGALTVFPAEVVAQNLKAVQKKLLKELRLNATDIFIGAHPSLDATASSEKKKFLSHYEPLFICLIAVAGACLTTLLIAIIFFKCRQKGVHYSTDTEKLNKEPPYCMRGHDLNPEHEILRDERQQIAQKDGGIVNGDRKHLVRQNGDDGWMVPIGDMPFEDQNAPAIQDTRL